ncbi:MAG: tetratricopeptide repeat protein [Candidatus Latescibacterota bacterium]
MSKSAKFFYLLIAALVSAVPVAAQQGDATSEAKEASSQVEEVAAEGGDEDWLNTVWTQVDDMVKEEEFKLQETVTVAGVRGAEAEDNILAKLYYKGGKRYPSQDKLVKAIKTLQEALSKNPKSPNAPKQKFFVAQCYEKLGQTAQARDYYSQVAKEFPQSPYAAKAQNKISQMSVE